MIILGLDPGSRKIGYAFLSLDGQKISYLTSGIILVEHIPNFIDRLGTIHRLTLELVQKIYLPDEIAIESLIYVKSPTALIKLAQARGAMLSGLSEIRNGKIFEYSPNLVKSMTTGFGHADKESVSKFVSMMFGKIAFKTNDESDAVAIALCHSLSRHQIQREQELPVKKSSRSKKSKLSEMLKHSYRE